MKKYNFTTMIVGILMMATAFHFHPDKIGQPVDIVTIQDLAMYIKQTTTFLLFGFLGAIMLAINYIEFHIKSKT